MRFGVAITYIWGKIASHGWDLPRTSPDPVQRLEDGSAGSGGPRTSWHWRSLLIRVTPAVNVQKGCSLVPVQCLNGF